MKNEYLIFKLRININKINNDVDLRNELLKQKVIHHKYRYKIQNMECRELKNFLYTNKYKNVRFEGVGLIFIYIKNKNLKDLIKYIIELNMSGINILRLMIYTLNNIELYDGKFLLYLMEFKNNYEKKFKGLLFELGQKYNIDKLDLINLFKKLIFK